MYLFKTTNYISVFFRLNIVWLYADFWLRTTDVAAFRSISVQKTKQTCMTMEPEPTVILGVRTAEIIS